MKTKQSVADISWRLEGANAGVFIYKTLDTFVAENNIYTTIYPSHPVYLPSLSYHSKLHTSIRYISYCLDLFYTFM